ncbi:hypothetical protein D3C86_1617300 [compost metagenome]
MRWAVFCPTPGRMRKESINWRISGLKLMGVLVGYRSVMQAFDLGINAAARGGQTVCRTRRKQRGHRSLLTVNEDARACLQRSHVRWLDAPG